MVAIADRKKNVAQSFKLVMRKICNVYELFLSKGITVLKILVICNGFEGIERRFVNLVFPTLPLP